MKKFYRAICLICASFFIGASNMGGRVMGCAIWTGDDVIHAAKKFESFLNELDKK